jgi:hypothetical protein
MSAAAPGTQSAALEPPPLPKKADELELACFVCRERLSTKRALAYFPSLRIVTHIDCAVDGIPEAHS